MPMFRVTVAKTTPVNPIKNPFSPAIDPLKPIPCTVTRRMWEFEAKDEKAVRRLFNQAIKAGAENVRGFELESIEPMDVAPARSGE